MIAYEPNGNLEFHAGDYASGRKVIDGKEGRLEDLLSKCVGALLREGRDCITRAEHARLREIERQEKARQRNELAMLVREEERKVGDLEALVAGWKQAQHMRAFIGALEKAWAEAGRDLSPEGPEGQQIIWMKQQANRIDPLIESPPSVLDRKRELEWW